MSLEIGQAIFLYQFHSVEVLNLFILTSIISPYRRCYQLIYIYLLEIALISYPLQVMKPGSVGIIQYLISNLTNDLFFR